VRRGVALAEIGLHLDDPAAVNRALDEFLAGPTTGRSAKASATESEVSQ